MVCVNPIELERTGVKYYLRGCNVTGDLSLKTIQEATKNAEKSITESDWEDYIMETELWQKERLMENEIDSMSFLLAGSSPAIKIPTITMKEVSLSHIQNTPPPANPA